MCVRWTGADRGHYGSYGFAERINQLRRALAKLAAKHGWTFRDAPR